MFLAKLFPGRAALVAVALAGISLAQTPPKPPAPPDPPEGAIARAFTMFSSGSKSFLGVGVSEVETERAKELKLKEERGVEITRVESDSPAAKAGLQKGDVVLEYQGQRVEGTEQFVRLVRETPAGRQVKLLISRGGSTQTVAATIAANKDLARLQERIRVAPRIELPDIHISPPDIPRVFMSYSSSAIGVSAESLEPQLAAYFGVKEGVLVRSVVKGSPAEKAGLKAGDVILKVDKTDVTTPREVSSAVRKARAQKSFPVTAMRDRKEITLSVTIEEEERGERGTVRPGRLAISFPENEL